MYIGSLCDRFAWRLDLACIPTLDLLSTSLFLHTCILDLGSFVLDLICILPLDLRVFCFCSHFGYQAKQPCCWLITIACQWHPVNGLLAAISRLHHARRRPTNRNRCRKSQNEIGGWSRNYGHGLVPKLGSFSQLTGHERFGFIVEVHGGFGRERLPDEGWANFFSWKICGWNSYNGLLTLCCRGPDSTLPWQN